MLKVRHSEDRGVADIGWLKSRHTFSFGHYFDLNHMGFGPLRVINEDRVIPGAGFGTHPHKDMEIISYVIEGGLAHEDSTGTGSVIKPGDVQRMSAGSGIAHSEFNASEQDPVHFLQIWIIPAETDLEPSYEEKRFSNDEKLNQWRLVGSPDGREGSVTIHQDVNLYSSLIEEGQSLDFPVSGDRKTWLQIVKGHVQCNGLDFESGDGVAIEEDMTLELNAIAETEILLFDMKP